MKHGDHLTKVCRNPKHGRRNGQQIDTFDAKCPSCKDLATIGEHDHLHDEPPYKAGCERCSTQREVRCRCGQYH